MMNFFANNKRVINTSSEDETLTAASEFAAKVKFGSVIALQGNLGAGKTVFARGFARGLGINEVVCSPTFNIIREYRCNNGKWLYHMDLYRINDSDSALAFGIDEYLGKPDSISLVEWPERILEILPSGIIKVTLERKSDESREISFEGEFG